MEKELIIDVSADEINIALLEDSRLVELHKEKSNVKFAVGDIYLGRVKKTMPGLNAAFVDVGFEKDAFLHYLDLGPQFRSLDKYVHAAIQKKGKLIPFSRFNPQHDIDKDGKITEVIKTGQPILVQVAKEPISTKGPRLTSEISIAGRNLVLIPFSDKVSVSQKISSNEEKIRLKSLMQSILPRNYGVIVRTVAEGKKVALLDAELRSLVKKWESAYPNIRDSRPPKLFIGEMNRTSALLRDLFSGSFNKIHVNNEDVSEDIRDYLVSIAPDRGKIVKTHKARTDIFDHFGVSKQIKSLFGKTISFKEGAYLIIEHTEALHVIDVNSGNRSKVFDNQEANALEVNLSAADEIARQLRLRDMGGIIVVDFIDMQSGENKQKLYDRMKKAMEHDRTKHNILPLSKFGLMQITRQRVRPEMMIKTQEVCPSCNGTGKISPSILFTDQLKTAVAGYLAAGHPRKFVLKVHPYVAAFLEKGLFPVRKKWNNELKCKMKVIPSDAYSYFEYRFFGNDGEEIVI